MDFISNQKPQILEMLESMGLSSVETLWQDIPEEIVQKAPREDDGLSESEGLALIKKIGSQNTYQHYESYIGAGAYNHYVPALVRSVIGKSGFLTAYTPYQAEASQGLLQTIFEFQTAIARLTGLQIANASLYDGASACAEAMLMACRINSSKNKVLIPENLHPHYQKVIEQYLLPNGFKIKLIPINNHGNIDHKKYHALIKDDVAGILFAYPNFFGTVEEIKELISQAKAQEIIVAISANPLAYGLFHSAGELGADIAVGDCQPFGIALQLGGPYAGYLSCKQEYARQIPGRIVGKTKDHEGNEGFVLTLQTREQHIRREKATSNICSNQALFALASLVAMLWYGPEGIAKLALTNYQRANYLKNRLEHLPKVRSYNMGTVFNEFVIELEHPVDEVIAHFRKHHIEPGLALNKYFPTMKNHLLINVTEIKSIEALNRYVEVAEKILS